MSKPSILTECALIDLWVPHPPDRVAGIIRSQPRWTFRLTPGQFTGTVEGREFALRGRMRRRWTGDVGPFATGTLSPERGGTRVRGEVRLASDARSSFRRIGFVDLAVAALLAVVGFFLGWPWWTTVLLVVVAVSMAFVQSSAAVADAAHWRDATPDALARALQTVHPHAVPSTESTPEPPARPVRRTLTQ
ncbi:MAG: hypothetical protein R3F61_25025 [Myxococcota bacterium]